AAPQFQTTERAYRIRDPQFRPHPQQHRPDDHRNWVNACSRPPPQCERFTVLAYNILADYLARDHRSKLYFHIPHHILDWEWRKKRLFLEFGLWSPDIMCLQEVDRFHDLEEELTIRGYAGIWKMRTGNAVDGCAIFWRTNRFQLQHEEHIEFNKLGLRDNVAQICVLESRNQNPVDKLSTAPASSDQSRGVNQIVICNIHVLYNPKRGEMKLGQVRMLLDRAYAVSRNWHNAPVIVCGDFNATPNSPLYKFISEQKLDLSGLARDQISGQRASTIYAPRAYVGSRLYRPQQTVDNGTGAMDIEEGSSLKRIDVNQNHQNDIETSSAQEKLDHGGHSSTIQTDHSVQSTLSAFHSQSNEGMSNELINNNPDSSSDKELAQESKDLLHGEINVSNSELLNMVVPMTDEDLTDAAIFKENLNQDLPFKDNQSYTSPAKTMFSEDLLDRKLHNDSSISMTFFDMASGVSCSISEASLLENIDASPALATEERVGADISCQSTSRMEQLNSLNEVDKTMMESLDSSGDFGNTSSGEMKPCSENNATLDVDNHNICIDSNPEESNTIFDKAVSGGESYMEHLEDHGDVSQDASEIDNLCGPEENPDPNFLRELLGTEDADAEQHPFISKIQDDFCSTAANMAYSYNPYLWTPSEIEAASGNPECNLVEHRLKLRSAYTDVEDKAGTKDSNREPEVTSYNRLFMGTVDYIWCSEGLQTVKVLDTIPKHILRRTSGFPTRRWGSDHLALACELAFTNGVESIK
ncbi:carbon catabolite repressor protein 4 homolog 6, partial [Asparagus officinalis]|uniref:carbon catabolite repressor protein 4 homolog 6 n=1 Tax=Asparagus officinalis TaxID=4686 RepID=UPI00098E6CD5